MENSKNIIIGISEVGTNTINRMRKMRVSKYLLLWLSLFFFNICFASCRNQKAEKVEQGDRMEVGEGKNDSLLEILRGHEYVYGGEKMSIDSTFSIMDTMAFPFDENLIVVNGNREELGPTFSFIIDTETKKSILLPSNRGCIGFTSEEGLPICLLMASLADILSFLFMMKKETSSRKCRLKIIKKMRSYDCNRIDNLYSAAQESNSCNFCVSIDSGKNSICIYWHARCWDV